MDRLKTVARLRERLGDRAWAIVALSPFWFFFGFHELLAPAQLSEGTPIEMIPGGGSAARSATAGARIRVGGLSVAAGTARTQRMWSNRGGVLVEVKHVYVPVGGVLVDTME